MDVPLDSFLPGDFFPIFENGEGKEKDKVANFVVYENKRTMTLFHKKIVDEDDSLLLKKMSFLRSKLQEKEVVNLAFCLDSFLMVEDNTKEDIREGYLLLQQRGIQEFVICIIEDLASPLLSSVGFLQVLSS